MKIMYSCVCVCVFSVEFLFAKKIGGKSDGDKVFELSYMKWNYISHLLAYTWMV